MCPRKTLTYYIHTNVHVHPNLLSMRRKTRTGIKGLRSNSATHSPSPSVSSLPDNSATTGAAAAVSSSSASPLLSRRVVVPCRTMSFHARRVEKGRRLGGGGQARHSSPQQLRRLRQSRQEVEKSAGGLGRPLFYSPVLPVSHSQFVYISNFNRVNIKQTGQLRVEMPILDFHELSIYQIFR